LHYRGIDSFPSPIIEFVDMLKDSFSLLLKKRLKVDIRNPRSSTFSMVTRTSALDRCPTLP
jgi:hypothetical protein